MGLIVKMEKKNRKKEYPEFNETIQNESKSNTLTKDVIFFQLENFELRTRSQLK